MRPATGNPMLNNQTALRKRALPITCATLLLILLSARQLKAAHADIASAALLQPSQLQQILTGGGPKPLVLQVGSHVLYAEAHIPGAEYAGPAGQDAGHQALEDRAKKLDRNKFIVLYCGCCPWIKCPNIRAAYEQMQALGFKNVKVLYIATDFGTDWVSKGYPVVKGR